MKMNYHQKRKNDIVKIMGGKCVLCGYNKCNAALELHHIDPTKKDFSLSISNIYKKWEDIISELKKCILLCSNCHKEIHYNEDDNVVLESSFKEEIAKEITNRVEKQKEKSHSYCAICKKEITLHSKYCSLCKGKITQKVKRPNREELKDLIRNKTFVEIGKEYNVSDKTIVKWCIKENLPFRKKDINSFSNNEWFKL